MKITVNVPKVAFSAGTFMALIGGCTDINHMGWLNWAMMAVGVGLMALVTWATAQKRTAAKNSKSDGSKI